MNLSSFRLHLLHFRKKHSRMAKAIEDQTGRDVSIMSDEDYLELEESFRILARRYHCSVEEVENSFIVEVVDAQMCVDYYSSRPIPNAWEYEHIQALVESRQRSIKVENTTYYLRSLWLREIEGSTTKDSKNAQPEDTSMTHRWHLEMDEEGKKTIVCAVTKKPYVFFSSDSISRIYDSLERLAFKYECPIGQLKKAVINSLDGYMASNPTALYDLARHIRSVEVPAESMKFNIDAFETGHFYVATWIEERADEIEELQRELQEFRNHLKEENLLEPVENKIEELKLAPDLSRNNNLENKLFRIAQQLAGYIGYYFQPFPEGGFYEALMYCGILLLNFRSDYKNELDLSKVQDAFFLLLWDELMAHTNLRVTDVPMYFNQRVLSWGEDERQMKDDSDFQPRALYYAFYVAPLKDISEYYEHPLPTDADLHRFRAVIDAMKVQLGWKQSLWKRDVDFIGKEIRERVEALKNQGLTPLAISQIIGPLESDPYGLIIDENLRVILDKPEHTEVPLPPIHKAVYLLFLKHPEGINFKEMDKHRVELENCYMKISHRSNLDDIQATIDRLISPFNNSLNEKCARIKSIFASVVPEDMVKWFVIEGEKGEKKSIALPRSIVNWSESV